MTFAFPEGASAQILPGRHVACIEELLERVTHMPDIEAEQELLARKARQSAETARLQIQLRTLDNARGVKGHESREIGYRLQEMTAENALLTAALKQVRVRMERTNWGNAVRAVFGSEGWAQCREWMAQESAFAAHGASSSPGLPENDESMDVEVERPRG